jgi:adenylate kinase
MNTTKLIIVRGIPGSGKSTLARLMSSSLAEDTAHFEADMYFIGDDGEYRFDVSGLRSAHAWCQDQTEKEIIRMQSNNGGTVIVSNTFTTKKELTPYFKISSRHGIIPSVIHCQNTFKSIHNVPEDIMVAMQNRFEYDLSSLFGLLK